jgi:hypothetical protein
MSDGLGSHDPAVVSRHVQASPAAVWSVLADGWLYATWVVGTSRVRAVDADWPALGSKIHHSFGLWPAVIDDTSEVLRTAPEREMLLKARGWPAGEAHVKLMLQPAGEGATLVSVQEDVVAGPALAMPRPLRQLLVVPRNREALARLAYIAEGRSHPLAGAPPRASRTAT